MISKHLLQKAKDYSIETGGFAIRILIVLMTLMVVGGIIILTLTKNREEQQVNHRKAMAISEYGLLKALEKLHENPSCNCEVNKTFYDGGWYKVSTRRTLNADMVLLTITSEGHLKYTSDKKICVLSLSVIDGDSLWVRHSML